MIRSGMVCLIVCARWPVILYLQFTWNQRRVRTVWISYPRGVSDIAKCCFRLDVLSVTDLL